MKKKILVTLVAILCIGCIFITGCKAEKKIENAYSSYETEANDVADSFEKACKCAQSALKKADLQSERDNIKNNFEFAYETYTDKLYSLRPKLLNNVEDVIYDAAKTESYYTSEISKTISELGEKDVYSSVSQRLSDARSEFYTDYWATSK